MHNGEDRGGNEGTLCAHVKRMIFSETHITQDPESPKAWALPLLFAVGNDVSPLTMNAFEMSDISGETEWGQRAGEKETSDLSPQVFESHVCHYGCLSSFSIALFCHTLPQWFLHTSIVEECLMQAPLSSKTSGGACIFTEGPKSREMLLKDRISPVRNTCLANSLPFLPGLPTPILSVRSVVLLGRLQGGALQERVAGSLRPSKTLQGSASHPTTLRFKVRSVCRTTQPPLLGWRRNVCTLPLSIFCLTWFIGFWFMTAEHVLLTYSRSGCQPKLKQTQRSRHFVTHWYDNEWVKRVTPIETRTFPFGFYWCTLDLGFDLFPSLHCAVLITSKAREDLWFHASLFRFSRNVKTNGNKWILFLI